MATLLATTSKSVLRVDTESDSIDVIETGHGVYYGMATRHDLLYVAARNRGLTDSMEHTEQIRVIDNRGNLYGSLRNPLFLDLHSIAWVEDELWVAATALDTIVTIDSHGNAFTVLPYTDAGNDRHHINTLAVAWPFVAVVAHNHSDPSEISYVHIASRRTALTRVKLGMQAHNFWVRDGETLVCSSSDGAIVGNRGLHVPIDGVPRGVAVHGEQTFIGVSPVCDRASRDEGSPRIDVFGPAFQLERSIELPAEGQVMDLMMWSS